MPDHEQPASTHTLPALGGEESTEFWNHRVSERKVENLVKLVGRNIDKMMLKVGLSLDLRDKKILDCGCGAGDLTIALAQRGAAVHAIDTSTQSLDIARQFAERLGVVRNITFDVMAAESMTFPNESFDLVVGKMILHHIDLQKAAPEIRRVMKRGGAGLFVENNARSRLLMWARKSLTGKLWIPRKSDDFEYPLSLEELANVNRVFDGKCEIHFTDFYYFRLIGVYVFKRKFRSALSLLGFLDHVVYTLLPFMRKYSYRQTVVLRRPLAST